MYTHVCIRNGVHQLTTNPSIKKGDYATLIETKSHYSFPGNIAYRFEEDPIHDYSTELFLPLPPQKEKTVYVAVSEQLVESVPEPVLN